jgi:hypothetical protein
LQVFLFSNSDNIGSVSITNEQSDATESIDQISTIVVKETILLDDTIQPAESVNSQDAIGLNNTVQQHCFDFLQETIGYAATIQEHCFDSLQDTIGLSNTLTQNDEIVLQSKSGNDNILLLQESILMPTMSSATINEELTPYTSQLSTAIPHLLKQSKSILLHEKLFDNQLTAESILLIQPDLVASSIKQSNILSSLYQYRLFRQLKQPHSLIAITDTPQFFERNILQIFPNLFITDTDQIPVDISSNNLSPTTRHRIHHMDNFELYTYCELLSYAGYDIPFSEMSDDQLIFYCKYKCDALFPRRHTDVDFLQPCKNDVDKRFLLVENCVRLARPDDLTIQLPEYLRYSLIYAWPFVQDADSFSQWSQSVTVTDIAHHLFVTLEQEFNFSPIPLQQRYLRACLYFHEHVTARQYHPVYRDFLKLAFGILTSAKEWLQSNPSQSVSEPDPVYPSPETQNTPTESSLNPQHTTPFADKTLQEVLDICDEYKLNGKEIPVHDMTEEQFLHYCASITDTHYASIARSFQTVSQLVYRRFPDAKSLPRYIAFAVQGGAVLLSEHNHNVYIDWRHPSRVPEDVADKVFETAETELHLPAGTIDQRYRKLSLHFHPDKLSHQYHSAYTPFISAASCVLTVAWNLLQWEEDDDDIPDLVFDTDDSSDDDDNIPPGPAVSINIAPTMLAQNDALLSITAAEFESISNDFNDHICSIRGPTLDDNCDFSSDDDNIDHPADSTTAPIFLQYHEPQFSAAHPVISNTIDITNHDIITRYEPVILNAEIFSIRHSPQLAEVANADYIMFEEFLQIGEQDDADYVPEEMSCDTFDETSDLQSLSRSLDELLLHIQSIDKHTDQFPEPTTSRTVEYNTDLEREMLESEYGVQHSTPIQDPLSTKSSASIYSAQHHMQPLPFPDGNKYIITFRGSAQYLKHNNFQYYTDNGLMTLNDIITLVSELLVNQQAFKLVCFCMSCPSVTSQLCDSIILQRLCQLCLSLPDRALHIDAFSHDGCRFLLGWFTVENVGDLPSIHNRPRDEYYFTPSWYQQILTIGIPPCLPTNQVHPHSYYRVTFVRNTTVQVHDQVQTFASSSTVYDIQIWLKEILSNTYHEQMVTEDTQLHFLQHHPVITSTNISSLVMGDTIVWLHVLSKSPLIVTDESEVTRIYFGKYSIQKCFGSMNGREPSLSTRREQLHNDNIRIDQASISTTIPIRSRIAGYDTDRPNFHAYVIRFCSVLPADTQQSLRTPSFEYLEFDNHRGIRHLCWLISQTTAIATSHIQVYSTQHPRLGSQVNASRTLADLCDIFSGAQNAHIHVCAEPPRGVHRDLGIITVERVGTLRPQLQPPYLTGAVRY